MSTLPTPPDRPAPVFRFAGRGTPPPAGPRIFCDGSADASFRPDVDLELSHWIPNRTPDRYRADTSTAICLRFAGDPLPGEWSEVINNHVDTDGILSVFAVARPRVALAHREVLAQAAAMGDFMGWGDEAAQRLYQGLSLLKSRLLGEGVDPREIYLRAFDAVEALLEGAEPPSAEAQEGIAALHRALRLVESGDVERRQPHERLAVYSIPARLAEGAELERALRIPDFDAPLSDEVLVLPQARARLDAQRLVLQSTACDAGWYHDLWLPGYVWAETPDSWRPTGLVVDSANTHRLDAPAWGNAATSLQRKEAAPGRWALARLFTPFECLKGRGYPVVLAFLRGGRPAPSALPPEAVSAILLDAGIAG